MATSLLAGVNPQAAQRAKSEYGKYSPDIDGLRQCVADFGGMVMVDRAVEFATSHPRVKGYLQKAGINPEQIRTALQNNPDPNPSQPSQNKSTQTDVYKNRLSKLR